MASYKNITINKRGGGTRLQRVKVLASGKYKFVKNIGRKLKKRTSRTRKASPTRRKGVRRMPRKKKRKGGKSITQQAFKWIRVGALAAPAIRRIAQGYADPPGVINNIISDYTGYNMTEGIWRWDYLVSGWAPYVSSVLTTVGIPKLIGIIRRL